ncbi:MAG: general secretion pathway protein GspK [Gemmatimonadaceae bacterium]|nr:general secretion pathway protein GspK [Gemmatimonadaceae bacterium]
MSARRRVRARRGVALLLVLGLVAVLGSATATLAGTARAATDDAAGLRARATARTMAESGIAVGLATLGALLASGDSTLLNAMVLDNAAGGAIARDTIGDGVYIVAASDPGAQLDLNRADVDALRLLLSTALPAAAAAQVAATIERRRAPEPGLRVRRAAFRDVVELRAVPGMTADAFARIAPFVTVDGDGSINRATAPAAVRAVAGGSEVDAPTRVVLVARGWRVGHPLTHEITAVYDVTQREPRVVHWRERDL